MDLYEASVDYRPPAHFLIKEEGQFHFWKSVDSCHPFVVLSLSNTHRHTHTRTDPAAHWPPVSHTGWRLAGCN